MSLTYINRKGFLKMHMNTIRILIVFVSLFVLLSSAYAQSTPAQSNSSREPDNTAAATPDKITISTDSAKSPAPQLQNKQIPVAKSKEQTTPPVPVEKIKNTVKKSPAVSSKPVPTPSLPAGNPEKIAQKSVIEKSKESSAPVTGKKAPVMPQKQVKEQPEEELDDLDRPEAPENEAVYDKELENLDAQRKAKGQTGPAQTKKIIGTPVPGLDEIENEAPAAKPSKPAEPVLTPEEAKRIQTEIAVGLADVILLKNGESLEGVIREHTDSIVSIETEYGLKVLNVKDIEFIDQIPEKDRFSLLEKLERLQQYHRQSVSKELSKEQAQLSKEVQIADNQKEILEAATGTKATDLFSLTQERLDEIIKEFSQFPPNFWRYYHRKGDATKAILRLNRLMRYAHPDLKETIDLYITAFNYKIKELDTRTGSALRNEYEETYKRFFRVAEKRRLTVLNSVK